MSRGLPLTLEQLSVGVLLTLDLTITPGQIVCLSGASGSGKSRLLRAVADLEPHDGDVRLGEQAQSRMAGHLWRRRVMLVPAESHWWADSVGEHFIVEPVMDDLAALGFEHEVLGWQVSRLSSGEKQRLALLRALCRGPSALLLDEPTANLDETSVHRVETWLMARIRQEGWPVLWVAHDPGQIARVADRHLRIEARRLVDRAANEAASPWT
ncbi:ABC-type lipoprotein export system, ATPase component [Modicisalibacter ilicicola DSM 19980]|uniref:ABC-type lipoprotein export system, ATPase component n=1 Tax=Modicisalibacter ilicicola DSM 19980 TaxID=1121942 RepID=A0A1M4YKZ1_9GAMM|nr:ATP-binding cassette domain-containing protein [Halomonas ilicicola]SHF06424.1 ABC-type lipoprotein export system, ATPase component [Halomonas ilicicola DSM 19980]